MHANVPTCLYYEHIIIYGRNCLNNITLKPKPHRTHTTMFTHFDGIDSVCFQYWPNVMCGTIISLVRPHDWLGSIYKFGLIPQTIASLQKQQLYKTILRN